MRRRSSDVTVMLLFIFFYLYAELKICFLAAADWARIERGVACYVCLELTIDGLVQERRNSIGNALALQLSCTNPSIIAWPWVMAGIRNNIMHSFCDMMSWRINKSIRLLDNLIKTKLMCAAMARTPSCVRFDNETHESVLIDYTPAAWSAIQ